MKYLIALAAAALLGLLAFMNSGSIDNYSKKWEPTYSRITVIENPKLSVVGHAKWDGDQCTITLRNYPVCLAHEVRHCLEGDFHDEKPNDSDCYDNN